MARESKEGPANDDALSVGDLLNAVDAVASDDPEKFGAATAILSTDPGQKMLQAIQDIAARLVGQEHHEELARHGWTCSFGGALICSSRANSAHLLEEIGLTTLGDSFLDEDARNDQRPTFKVLRWHAAGGASLELMPPTALREAFLLTLTGQATVHVDGVEPLTLSGSNAATAMWVGSIEKQPWLPRFRIRADGIANGLLVLLGEHGVPLIERGSDGHAHRHGDVDFPVALAPSDAGRDAAAYWDGLKARGIVGPQIFRLPRGRGVPRWCRTLLDVEDDPRDDVPHALAVTDGLLRPRESASWRALREKVAAGELPSLMFRVLQLPAVSDSSEAQLERHDGAEALFAWHGTLTFLTRKRGAAAKRRLYVPLRQEDEAVERATASVRPDGSLDVVTLDSDHFHTIVARNRAAVALHFTGSQVGWSSKWLQLVDDKAAAARTGSRGNARG